MSQKRERDERVSREQNVTLLHFMEDHEDFARGKLLGADGRHTWRALWEQLTMLLNNIEGGATKRSTKWQSVWTDLKNKIKRKASDINISRRTTGGGPGTDKSLSEYEERILSLMSQEAVYGLQGPDGVPLESDEPRPGGSQNVEAAIPESDLRDDLNEEYVNLSTSSADVSEYEEVTHVRKRSRPSSQGMYETLVQQNSELNNLMREKLDLLIEERKTSNVILLRIAESLEKLTGGK